jgi:hypothetical protein
MEENKRAKGCLIFELDDKYHITRYFQQNMNFYALPEQFLQENFFKMLPKTVHDGDRTELHWGFKRALNERKIVKVPYSSNNEQFLAKICVMSQKGLGLYDYLVKITKKHQGQ